ncbi:MAG TPA: hypothetical protein VNJ49_00700 [Bradyrhizobium sp.]|nr:hypothetical protein [Bradyrhizobium sp.]
MTDTIIQPVCRLVLIASDDLIAGLLNRNGLKTGNGNRSWIGPQGRGVTTAILSDMKGLFGCSSQTIIVEPRQGSEQSP